MKLFVGHLKRVLSVRTLVRVACVLGALMLPACAVFAQTYNQIQFVIGTGGADLRGDCEATAKIIGPNGAVLQTVTLYNGSGSGWANNTSHTVTAALNPALKPSQITAIVITQIEHNNGFETDNNWNINSVVVSLSNNGAGSQQIADVSGNPWQRLTGSQPSATVITSAVGPPGTFDGVRFVIGTGGADLRGDSVAKASLMGANGAVLQTVTLYNGSGSGWANNTTNTVTAALNRALKPSDIARIVITQVEHNNGLETDNNWNINSVAVSLYNLGNPPHALMSFSGNPLARLTGLQPSITLPPLKASAGLGMTMPIDPGVETPVLNLDPKLPNGELPFGYQVPPAAFVDVASKLSGSCSSASNKGCLPAWNGTVNEQDSRLNPFFRTNAASQDARLLLARAVWMSLGLSLPGSVKGMSCGGSNAACSTALAQLAVTGRQAFNTFAGWNPSFPPASRGPQVADLVQLVERGHGDLPAIPASVSSSQLQTAATQVLTDAYIALWSIRSNDAAWRQFRLNSGWIAVSGEDDAPHRPVNVYTAPFSQYDIPVPVTINGRGFMLKTRYMVAAGQTLLNPQPGQPPTQAPGIPVNGTRWAIPDDEPGALRGKNVIVYIHGGGSRLEEAVPMAKQFISQFGAWSNNVIVISFDLPNSAYDDPMVTAVDGGQRMLLDASSIDFENGPRGEAPSNVNNFPVLNFTLNFINNFISTLNSQGTISAHQVLAVMGGSLGGNTSLLLGMNPLPPPFHLEYPLAFSAPADAPGGAQPTIVSWSPTSMVSYHDNAATIIGANMCCSLIAGKLSAGPTWEAETTDTRSHYFSDLYFSSTGVGLPPDPVMWYRDNWTDPQNHSAAASFITQSRFDRYEIYSPISRLWTTAIDTEQAVYSFQDNTDTSRQSYTPNYEFIHARLLLATGACDDYDNGSGTAPFAPPPTMATGICAGHGVGNTGTNALSHQDIYGFTHDVANDMRNATGRTLFLNDTGHSIHDERPIFFSQQIFNFITTADNNINITLRTGSDDLRWNSEVHAIVGLKPTSTTARTGATLDFPLNYWFHPWPATSASPNNPCGACYKLVTSHLASGSGGDTTENNFTIALPSGVTPASISSLGIEFIAGTSSAGNTTDAWNLASVAACLPNTNGGFISDGFPASGPLKRFAPSSNNQPILWQPPSFQSPSLSSRTNNCSGKATNPPANSDVPDSIWNSGFQVQN
jgi:hypothetical protein